MIWLYEGTEATGKTTVAQRHAADINGVYLHFAAPTHDNWVDEYLDPIALANVESRHIIMDRGFLSELVWSEYLHRPCLIDQTALRIFHKMQIHITLMERPSEDIVNTMRLRGESEDHIFEAINLIPAYRRHFNKLERMGFRCSIGVLANDDSK